NTPNNQPVTMKYLYYARQQGTRIAVVNPYREPGLENYYVPSVAESALFGTRFADQWFAVDTGGDLAFLTGVFRVLLDEGWIDREFIGRCTHGFEAAAEATQAQSWEELEANSGTTRGEMRLFAAMLHRARHGIFVWSMGLTQHAHGVDTVRALVNVALALGWVGRPHAGLMPIRGHSGVQGGAEVGCVPSLDSAQRGRFEQTWNFTLPEFRGYTAAEMIHAAADDALDTFWITGGNFLETLPDPPRVQRALAAVRTRIHQDIVVTSMMLTDPADTVILLPATTRYESPGGGTETTTERRIIFSPEIEGRRIGSAKPEWEVFGEIAARVAPGRAARFTSSAEIREEIARAIPLYRGIEELRQESDHMQWGGEQLFADGHFATLDGRAHFSAVGATARQKPRDAFYVSTRRGKQFNSMIQLPSDPLTNATRDDVLISGEDAARLNLREGDTVRLTSSTGTFTGKVKLDRIQPGNLQVHWPEGNCLLSAFEADPESGEPDYNAVVSLRKVGV
ncbi:MAG: molybdopterin-dependent oxidoreductase, partial [Candidatus Solibacter sp.]